MYCDYLLAPVGTNQDVQNVYSILHLPFVTDLLPLQYWLLISTQLLLQVSQLPQLSTGLVYYCLESGPGYDEQGHMPYGQVLGVGSGLHVEPMLVSQPVWSWDFGTEHLPCSEQHEWAGPLFFWWCF